MSIEKVDACVVGTSLACSVLAACVPCLAFTKSALAEAGESVLHIDRNAFYGRHLATLSRRELDAFLANRPFTPSHLIQAPLEISHLKCTGLRDAIVNFDVQPLGLFSRCAFLDVLVRSGIGSKYLEFLRIHQMLVIGLKDTLHVPCTKEDVFSNPKISMKQKRLLMRFMQSPTGHGSLRDTMTAHGLDENLQDGITHVVATWPHDGHSIAFDKALERIKVFVGGIGRFGPTPLLSVMYGSGELVQSFCRYLLIYFECRFCAVHGGTYILNQDFSISSSDGVHRIQLQDGTAFESNFLITDSSEWRRLNGMEQKFTKWMLHLVAVFDTMPVPDVAVHEPVLIVFKLNDRAVYSLLTSDSTYHTTKNHCMFYLKE